MPPWFGRHLPDYTFPNTPTDRVVEQAHAGSVA
jgi:hypothetical protein